MRPRTVILGTVLTTAVVGATAFLVIRDNHPSSAADAPVETTADGDLVAVEQRDLVRSEELNGVVGHGDLDSLRLNGAGTITSLPSIGDVVQFGQSLLEVDGDAVVLLPGTRPAWRTLGAGVTKGEDVRQLEAALTILGYADASSLDVDDTWSSDTTAAVKKLQRLLGMPEDGRLETSEIVFLPEVVRIASIGGGLGDPVSAAALEVSGLQQSVNVSLSSSKASLLAVGDTVSIELPSGETVEGTVDEIKSAVVDGEGSVTFPVVISAPAMDVADGVPVDITVDVVAVENALAVPAEALLALAEGGYAVEVSDGASPTGTRLVGVEVGTFADGWVEILGDVTTDDQVVVP